MVLDLIHKILYMEDFKHMRKKYAFAIKGIVFLLLLATILLSINQILIPKYFVNNSWPTTSTYLGFYEMPKNSIDVLFLGSSEAATGFIPQELYNNYGITSYNLGCEQQNMLVSYYWLKEALRFQKPKAVVLETLMLFKYRANEPLNSTEACTRKALDYMKWSAVKKEAVKEICSIDTSQSESSYYFPNIRFHSRWTELSEDDFSYAQMCNHYEMKGFSTMINRIGENDYMPLFTDETEETTDSVALMESYVEKIALLCEENDIDLILVKNPATSEKIGKYNTTMQLAKRLNIRFYDFNTMQLYNDILFSFSEDMIDKGHPSITGAIKITNYLGKILQTDYGIEAQTNDAWERTRYAYSCLLCDTSLKYIPDIDTYLNYLALMKEHYSIFIAVNNDASSCLNDDIINGFRKLGLSFDLKGKYGSSYLAVISPNDLYEEIGYKQLDAKGTIRDGIVRYNITSAGKDFGSSCSIQIEDVEYAVNSKGLNIVVYNNLTKRVIDDVCFDTSSPELSSLR